MVPNKKTSSLRPSLSQLLLRSLEGQDEPKYATVPQLHSDEFRPSILDQYRYNNIMNSQDEISMMRKNPLSTLDHLSQRSNCSAKALTMRTLGCSLQPLWHYCASKIHLELDRTTAQVVSTIDMKDFEDEQKFYSLKQSFSQAPITSSLIPQSKFKSLRTKLTKKEPISPQAKEATKKELPNPCPRHAFELLPPLFESHTHTLLYQNSFLLDGVKYDYESNKRNQDHSISTKLRLNYLKFLKSVNRRAKPSDRDVVFGEAKVITSPAPQWENSRIDWLLNLERQQELRRKQLEEERLKLQKAEKNIKTSKASYFRFHKKHKDKNRDKDMVNKNRKKKQQDIEPGSEKDSVLGTATDMCTCFPFGNQQR